MGPAKDAIPYFSTLGSPVPKLTNPADWYIQILAIEVNDRDNCLKRVKSFADTFEKSPKMSEIRAEIKSLEIANKMIPKNINSHKYSSSLLSQIRWLLWRQMRVDRRDPAATKILALQSVFISVFIGLIFLQLDQNEIGVQNRLGVVFITIMQCNFGYIFSVVNVRSLFDFSRWINTFFNILNMTYLIN